MHEYPGFLPWYLGGEPTFTWNEIRSIMDDFKLKADEAKKEQDEMKRQKRRGKH